MDILPEVRLAPIDDVVTAHRVPRTQLATSPFATEAPPGPISFGYRGR